jgi:hypothetical protein
MAEIFQPSVCRSDKIKLNNNRKIFNQNNSRRYNIFIYNSFWMLLAVVQRNFGN